MTDNLQKEIRREFTDFVSPRAGDSLIEFGCGPGNFLQLVSNRCSHVIGLDASQQMLSRAEQRLKVSGISNVTLLQSTVESFEPKSIYNLAVGVVFLYLFSDPEVVLRKMKFSISPGGTVGTMNPSSKFVRSNLRTFIKKNKLRIKARYVLKDWLRASWFFNRYNDEEIKNCYISAGLESIQLKHTLDGMVVFVKGTRPLSSENEM